MVRWSRRFVVSLAAVTVSLAPGELFAQSARIFATNYSNGRVLSLDFTNSTSTVINTDANLRVGLQGAWVLENGANGAHLVVCDSNRGEVVLYPHPLSNVSGAVINSAILSPDGVSANGILDLYLVDSTPSRARNRKVYKIARTNASCGTSCTPTYGAATLIDGAVDSEALEDTKVIPNSSGGEDLYVLSRIPAMVVKYVGASACPQNAPDCGEPFITAFEPGDEPTGMTRLPSGDWLVATAGGAIRKFDSTGNFVSYFKTGLGNTKFKITSGSQDGINRVVLAARDQGRVLRFNADTGQAAGEITVGLQHPVGVAMSTFSVDSVSETDQTAVLNGVNVSFDNVKTEGVVSSTVTFGEAIAMGLQIPTDYAQPCPETGGKLRVVAIDTNALFDGQITIESPHDGSHPDCPISQMYHCASPDSPPIAEGLLCHNIFYKCGSDEGASIDFSHVILGLCDARDPRDIAAFDVVNFQTAVTTYLKSLIKKKTRMNIERALNRAATDIARARWDGCVGEADYILNQVASRPADFDSDPRNTIGEVKARANMFKAQCCLKDASSTCE